MLPPCAKRAACCCGDNSFHIDAASIPVNFSTKPLLPRTFAFQSPLSNDSCPACILDSSFFPTDQTLPSRSLMANSTASKTVCSVHLSKRTVLYCSGASFADAIEKDSGRVTVMVNMGFSFCLRSGRDCLNRWVNSIVVVLLCQ